MTATLTGHGIGRGIALGPAIIQDQSRQVVPRYYIPAELVTAEAERLTHAFDEVDAHLTDLKRKLRVLPNRDPYLILEAHQALLRDRSFRDVAIDRVRRQRVNAEWSLEQTIRDIRQVFESVGDDYIRQRLDDILNLRDLVAERLVQHPADQAPASAVTTVLENAILVASDLTPHATLQAIRSGVRGIVLEGGSTNGHAAIIARSMGIPMVVGVAGLLEQTMAGQQLALDARSGEVFVAPAAETVQRITEQSAREMQQAGAVWLAAAGPALLRDGTIVAVLGNVDLPEEVAAGRLDAIDGIGLFRTEIPFLGLDEPSEDELEQQYLAMITAATDKSVVFRVLDLGGDKTPDGGGYGPLGLRGIRHLFANEDLFRRQLRAILRAFVRGPRAHGELREIPILLPMLTSAAEVRRARTVIERVAASLAVPMQRVRIGAMIETPAAAMVVDQIRREADFLSIGSNDLIQYVLAVDRNDPAVADIFDPLHPAVLRILQSIVDSAGDTPLTVCGEIAADLRLVPLLIGMGVRSLSMPVPYVPTIKPALRNYSVRECKALLKNCLESRSAAELGALVEVFVRSHTS